MRAIIIGGGIGGLTAALALRRRGIDAQVYEKSGSLRDVGAGISLWPNAVKALRKLALGERLQSLCLPPSDGALRRWNGEYISRTSARELERRFGGGMVVLHRADLLALLAENTGRSTLHLGHQLSSMNMTASGVSAKFTNGATVEGDVLISADGLHSLVRYLLGHRDKIRYSGYTAWRSVVPFSSLEVPSGETWGAGKRFGIFPMKGDRVYWFATNNANEGERDPSGGSQSLLLSLFKGWHEPIEDLIRSAENSTILRNDIYDRDPATVWGDGVVTLLGDAAHPMTPNLGQGACQAIEDAMELACCLADAARVDVGLKDYERKRIKRTGMMVLASRRLGMMAQLETPIFCRLRDLALQLIPSSVTYRGLSPVLGYEGHLRDWPEETQRPCSR